MKHYVLIPLWMLLAGIVGACGGIEPATSNSPTVTVGLGFGDDLVFDGVPDRYDPCKWFDSEMNEAAQVNVEIFAPVFDDDGEIADVIQIGETQTFVNGYDYQNGDPDGIHAEIPSTGGFLMTVTVYGEINEDCCPGPPPGRPVFRSIWPYTEYGGFPVFKMLPSFSHCLFF